MMPAHEPGTHNDRPGTSTPLKILRQTAPHGNEGLSSTGGSPPFEHSFSARTGINAQRTIRKRRQWRKQRSSAGPISNAALHFAPPPCQLCGSTKKPTKRVPKCQLLLRLPQQGFDSRAYSVNGFLTLPRLASRVPWGQQGRRNQRLRQNEP